MPELTNIEDLKLSAEVQAEEPRNMSNLDDIPQRVTTLEIQMGQVLTAIGQTNDSIKDTNNSIKELSSKFTASQKANWPLFVSFAGLILVFVVAVGGLWTSGIKSRLNHIETSQIQLLRDQHIDLQFRAATTQRLDTLDNLMFRTAIPK